MTSKITFSKIKYTVIKSPSDISKTERSEGKLQAGKITSQLAQGLQIDVLVLKKLPIFATKYTMTFDESNIRRDSRRCFLELPEIFQIKGKLPVHTNFFKKIKDGDTIMIILHKVIQ